MNRRELLKIISLSAVASYLPRMVYAQTMDTVWGPPVAASVLLGIANKNGQLAKRHPYQVKIWKNPDLLRAGVANKTMPVTIVPSYVAANLYNQGHDVVLLNIMTFGLLKIMGRDKDKLNSIVDLKGKSIVLPFKNDLPDLILQLLCKKQGLNLADIKVQYTTTPQEALGIFWQKKADYVLVPEPMATVCQLKGKMMHFQSIIAVLDIQEEWGKVMKTSPRIPQAGLMINRQFYQENKATIDALQADLVEAVTWAKANPDKAADIGADYLPVPSRALKTALPRAQLAATLAKDIADEILVFYKELYTLNPKIVGGKLPDKRLFSL